MDTPAQAPAQGTPAPQAPTVVASTTPEAAPPAKTPSKRSRADAAIKILNEAKAKVAREVPEVAKEAPPAEAPKAVETPEPRKEDTRVSRKILEIQEREAKLIAREEAISKKESDILTKEMGFKNLKANPLQVLKDAGLTFQEFADAVIADAKTPENVKRALQEQSTEIKALRDKLEADEKAANEKRAREEDELTENRIKDFKGRLNGALEAAKDTYELIHAAGAQELVYDIMHDYWHEHGSFPDFKEAAMAAEKFLEDRARRMLGTKKLKPAEPPPEPPKAEASGVKTLTNNGVSGTPSTDNSRVLSKQERFQRAVAKIKFD